MNTVTAVSINITLDKQDALDLKAVLEDWLIVKDKLDSNTIGDTLLLEDLVPLAHKLSVKLRVLFP